MNEVCQITLEKLPVTLALPGSVYKLAVIFFFFFSYWFDLTFYDKLALETIYLLATWKMTVLGGDKGNGGVESELKMYVLHIFANVLFITAITTN